MKTCQVCGRTAAQHDRVDMRACQRKAEEMRRAQGRPVRLRPESTARLLVAEQEAEARGFTRGCQATRALILKWAIKADTFLPYTDRTRYRCQECGATWHGIRDAHPSSEECAVGEALGKYDRQVGSQQQTVRSGA